MPSEHEREENSGHSPPPNQEGDAEQRDVGGIFDRFVDNFLGLRRGRSTDGGDSAASSGPAAGSDVPTASTAAPAAEVASFRTHRPIVIPVRFLGVENAPAASATVATNSSDSSASATASAEAAAGAGTAAADGQNATGTSNTSPSTVPMQTTSNEDATTIPPATPTEHRTIIITVNFVFSDSNNPQNPSRQGSLIMSLPNNPSNRDPRAIQEFIRLATQMAYSSILNDLDKDQGITLGKFNGFPCVSLDECEKQCPICFDEYVTRKRGFSGEEVQSKKRKTENTQQTSSETDSADTQNTLAPTESRAGSETGQTLDSTSPLPINTLDSTNLSPTGISGSTERLIPAAETLLPNGRLNTPVAAAPSTSTHSPRNTSPDIPLSACNLEFPHNPVKMPCGHIFGKSCLFEWLKTKATCPLCRGSVAEPRTRVTLPAESIRLVPDIRGSTGVIPFGTTAAGEAAVAASDAASAPESANSSANTSNGTGFGRAPDAENSALSYILAYLRRRGSGSNGNVSGSNGENATDALPPNPTTTNISSSPGFTSTFGSGSTFVAGNTLGTSAASFGGGGSFGGFGLLPTGVASRRTPTGVVTTSSDTTRTQHTSHSDAANEILDFLNLQSLVDGEDQVENDTSRPENATSSESNETSN